MSDVFTDPFDWFDHEREEDAMTLPKEFHQAQARAFLQYHARTGGEWRDNLATWAHSKNFFWEEYRGVKAAILELAMRGEGTL